MTCDLSVERKTSEISFFDFQTKGGIIIGYCFFFKILYLHAKEDWRHISTYVKEIKMSMLTREKNSYSCVINREISGKIKKIEKLYINKKKTVKNKEIEKIDSVGHEVTFLKIYFE